MQTFICSACTVIFIPCCWPSNGWTDVPFTSAVQWSSAAEHKWPTSFCLILCWPDSTASYQPGKGQAFILKFVLNTLMFQCIFRSPELQMYIHTVKMSMKLCLGEKQQGQGRAVGEGLSNLLSADTFSSSILHFLMLLFCCIVVGMHFETKPGW